MMNTEFCLTNVIVPRPQYRYFSISRTNSDIITGSRNPKISQQAKTASSAFYKELQEFIKFRKLKDSVPQRIAEGDASHFQKSGFSLNSGFGLTKSNRASSSTTVESKGRAARKFKSKNGAKKAVVCSKAKRDKREALPLKNIHNIISVLKERKKSKRVASPGLSLCGEALGLRRRNKSLSSQGDEVVALFSKAIKKMKAKVCTNVCE
jgi:hypothetical protein